MSTQLLLGIDALGALMVIASAVWTVWDCLRDGQNRGKPI
jgi:hypothetical protein